MALNEGMFQSQDQDEQDLLSGARSWQLEDQRPDTWSGFGWGVVPLVKGVGQGVAEGDNMLFGALHRGLDAITTGDETGDDVVGAALRMEMKGAADAVGALEQQSRHVAKALMPDPRTTGSAANLVQGFGKSATLATAGYAMGPYGASAMLALSEGYARYQDLRDDGVDEDTAKRAAAVEGFSQGLAADLPMHFPLTGLIEGATPLAQTLTHMAAGAGINVAFGAGSRYLQSDVLEKAGYPEMAAQMKPFDDANLAADGVTGLFFGGLHSIGHVTKKDIDPAIVDAAKGVQDRHEVASAGPGVPVDFRSQAINRESLEQGLADLLADRPVNLDGDRIDGATFAAPAEDQPAEGTVRYYHGGAPADDYEGPLWFTSDLKNAQGWASRSDAMRVWYVDVPKDHPSRGLMPEDQQAGMVYPSNVELPGELASQRRLLVKTADEAAREIMREEFEKSGVLDAADDFDKFLAGEPTEAEAPKKRNMKTPDSREDSILQFLAKHGKGLDMDEAEAQGIDREAMNKNPNSFVGIKRAFRRGGMSFDEAAEHLMQSGYPVLDDRGNYDPNVLLDRIDDELRGKKHYSINNPRSDLEAKWKQMNDDALRREFTDAEPEFSNEPKETQDMSLLATRARAHDEEATEQFLDANAQSDDDTIRAGLEEIIRAGEQRAFDKGPQVPGEIGRPSGGQDSEQSAEVGEPGITPADVPEHLQIPGEAGPQGARDALGRAAGDEARVAEEAPKMFEAAAFCEGKRS